MFVKQQGLCDLVIYVMFLKRTGEIENGVWHSASALKDYENLKKRTLRCLWKFDHRIKTLHMYLNLQFNY
ncbi:hypothetical protein AND4_06889 [Vibrio sp. AND4]|nr:hypothetical protein AND4_06889 [Vibrio sp. AND4]